MADKRPADKKPKGSGNPNRINRLLVKKATEDFKALSNLVLLTNLGITSEQNQELRATIREKKMKFRMVRSRLTMKAFSDLGEGLRRALQSPTCVLDGADPVEAAKAAMELVEKYNRTIKLVGGLDLDFEERLTLALRSLPSSNPPTSLIVLLYFSTNSHRGLAASTGSAPSRTQVGL